LPSDIAAAQREIEEIARGYGLDFFETIFELVEYDELNMLAAYGGFPVRYPHWRFGAQYDELSKGYTYGLQRIYEMVVNNDPCYAYLLRSNSMTDQKLVIAHVYAHCDFFKNNAWFAHTNRKMLDQMANHAARINRHIDRYGYETVEEFIDACLSIEDLIDPHLPHIKRREEPKESVRSPLAAPSEDEPQPPEVPRKTLHGGIHQPARRAAARAGRTKAEGKTAGREPVIPGRTSARRVAVPAGTRTAEKLAARHLVDYPRRSILLRPASPDQDHERRLGELLAFADHDPPRFDRCRRVTPIIIAERWQLTPSD